MESTGYSNEVQACTYRNWVYFLFWKDWRVIRVCAGLYIQKLVHNFLRKFHLSMKLKFKKYKKNHQTMIENHGKLSRRTSCLFIIAFFNLMCLCTGIFYKVIDQIISPNLYEETCFFLLFVCLRWHIIPISKNPTTMAFELMHAWDQYTTYIDTYLGRGKILLIKGTNGPFTTVPEGI